MILKACPMCGGFPHAWGNYRDGSGLDHECNEIKVRKLCPERDEVVQAWNEWVLLLEAGLAVFSKFGKSTCILASDMRGVGSLLENC